VGRRIGPDGDALDLDVDEDALLVVLAQQPVLYRPAPCLPEEGLRGPHQLCQALR
jgi:hypothetical protein